LGCCLGVSDASNCIHGHFNAKWNISVYIFLFCGERAKLATYQYRIYAGFRENTYFRAGRQKKGAEGPL
jgi:hypothetical protein